MELETQVQVAERLGYLRSQEVAALLQSWAEVGRILNRLLASVSRQFGS